MKVITSKVKELYYCYGNCKNILPKPLIAVYKTVYKAFVRPHLGYTDAIYDQTYKETFHQKLEYIQYNACLALSGTIRRSSREKLYQKLGLQSLQRRLWYRKFCLCYKIFKQNKPVYLFNLITKKDSNYNTRNTDKITLFHTKHSFFKNSLFPSTLSKWNQLDRSQSSNCR